MRPTDLLFDYTREFPTDTPNKNQWYWRLKMYNQKGNETYYSIATTVEPVGKYEWSILSIVSSSLTKTTNLVKENSICNSPITSIRLFTINIYATTWTKYNIIKEKVHMLLLSILLCSMHLYDACDYYIIFTV